MSIVETIIETDICKELKAQYEAGLVCAFEAANHLIDLTFIKSLGINSSDIQDFDELFEQLFHYFKPRLIEVNSLQDDCDD